MFENKKIFQLYNGEVINKNKEKINVFQFDQIDFNLADYSTNTILVPKLQERSSKYLLDCIIFFKDNANGFSQNIILFFNLRILFIIKCLK